MRRDSKRRRDERCCVLARPGQARAEIQTAGRGPGLSSVRGWSWSGEDLTANCYMAS